MDYIRYIVDTSTNFIATGGLLYGFVMIFIESLIPILPLGVFVALNVNSFGTIIGIGISWAATCLGCFLEYTFFKFVEKKYISSHLNKRYLKRIMRGVDRFKKISFPELVLLITLPFTPAFLINIVSGLARVPKEKFVAAILIGKVFMVTFWGYIGKSLLESVTDLKSIVFIALALILAYIISKIVSKKMKIS